jgi:putative ABC transport system permease protein
MKFLPYLFANLFRKKTRLILTLLSFTVALFLFGILAAIDNAFTAGVEVAAGVDRLVTINRISLIQPLPLSYYERIKRIPGVKYVTHFSWFGGVYQDEKNFFPQFAIDPDTFSKVYPEFQVPPDQWQAFLADQEGAVVGRVTAERFGFKVGDRIPIRGTIFKGTWYFNIRGIYKGTKKEDDESNFVFHWKYLDESRSIIKGMVGWYIVKVEDPNNAPQVVKAIDETFANSPYETKTDTEKAFASGFVQAIGNVRLILSLIGTVVFVTLLLVAGNTLSMSIRERTAELAVLKALGFTDGAVLWLVLIEALCYAAVGGLIGLLSCPLMIKVIYPYVRMFLPVFFLPWKRMALGLGIALCIGLAAGIIPAILAMKLRIVDALRRV